jgi:hypothetical protein
MMTRGTVSLSISVFTDGMQPGLGLFLARKKGGVSMVVLEDFTRLSARSGVGWESRVESCPRCGRPGLEEHSPDGRPLVVHSQTSEILGDGMLVEPQDCCALSRR